MDRRLIAKLALAATVVIIFAVAAVGVFLVLGGNSGAMLKPDDASLVARGEAVYMAPCAACHGRSEK